jgi:hypothetical protein
VTDPLEVSDQLPVTGRTSGARLEMSQVRGAAFTVMDEQ